MGKYTVCFLGGLLGAISLVSCGSDDSNTPAGTSGTGGATGGTGGAIGGSGGSTGGTGGATGGTGGATGGSGGSTGGTGGATGGTGASGGTGGTSDGGMGGSTGGTGGSTGGTGATGGAGGTSDGGTGGSTGGTGGSTGGTGGSTGGTGGSTGGTGGSTGGTGGSTGGTGGSTGGTGGAGGFAGGPPAGNPDGHCAVPAEAQEEDTSQPTHVIGNGTPQSCTSDAVVNTVKLGGIITFNCGPDPVTIPMTATAKIVNNTGPKIVIDGGGKVTLSGQDNVRILYQNTCDQAQVWTTSHCQDQDHPQLTVQNLTFVHGDATGLDPDGGGAIFVRGGRFKLINSRFFNNSCDDVGPDVGGASVRTLSQSQGLPVYVVNSTFGGSSTLGNECSNAGGLSSIGVSYTVINSLFSHNKAIGNGANPAKPGTPGGGSGGAIYNDGNTFTLTLCGVSMTNNTANEGGGAIFFVSNDHTGHLVIHDSVLNNNPSGQFETFPGIFYIGSGTPDFSGSTIQ